MPSLYRPESRGDPYDTRDRLRNGAVPLLHLPGKRVNRPSDPNSLATLGCNMSDGS
jgi:hypothetical protein